jgi:DNA-binding response OmpR family regulator
MKGRILVIDDDDELRRYVAEALATEGYQVATAANGEEGVQALNADLADLIILDLFMPKMEGFETLMELRRFSPPPTVLAVSGGGRFAAPDMLTIAGKLGAHKTLPKPFTCQELLETVEDLFAERAAQAA